MHPESYSAARALLRRLGIGEEELRGGVPGLKQQAERIGMAKLAGELGIGEATLSDIVGELEKPGRDVRDALPPPQLRDRVMTLEELTPGMVLSGTVRNVIDFGAFVDIGVHQDGLVHISELSDRFVRRPGEVVSVGDVVKVRVKSVDLVKKRIALSMKGL